MISHQPEQVLHLHGDELYQTALLLTLDPRQAEQALLRAARSLGRAALPTLHLVAFTAALVAALPAPLKMPARLPWPAGRNDSALLAALSALPLNQRLALDLQLRRDYEPAQVAALFGGDPAQAEAALRDGLLALAPLVEVLPERLLVGSTDPCEQIRAQLAVAPGAVFDPAVRTHMRTCGGCRSAEQAWQRVRTEVERCLRAALRDVTLPAPLAEQLVAHLTVRARPPLANRLLQPRALQIGVPIAVLLIIVMLVLPRTAPPTASSPALSSSQRQRTPREQVEQALATLYQAEGQEIWHGRYTIRWNFDDTVFATLSGELWRAPDGRYRAQLTHQDGGAPYEFLLAGRDYLWYARTRIYGQSIFGQLHDQYAQQVRIALPEAQHDAVLAERLAAGAWGVAGNYLRQAQAAQDVSSWGRQRAPDGGEYQVIGFRGFSPLDPPADANGQPGGGLTILLTIDAASGHLREVREVSGPANGEQVSRTVWQLAESGSITNEREAATLFTADVAYNGGGRFLSLGDERGLADPALPMVPATSIRPPTDSVASEPYGTRLPATSPPGIDRALIIAANPYEDATTVYLGPSKFLHLNQQQNGIDTGTLRNPRFERFDQPDQQRVTLLDDRTGQGFLLLDQQSYDGATESPTVQPAPDTTVLMQSTGFSRAELLAVADTLAPFDTASYRAQAALFRTPQPHDPAAFAALVAALEQPPLEPGQASSFVERHFSRQGSLPEPTIDVYHRPMYSQGGEWSQTEVWSRNNNGQLEIASRRTNDEGTIVEQMTSGAEQQYWYSQRYGTVYLYKPDQSTLSAPIVEPTWSVINLLGCGGTSLETLPDGTRVVTQIDQDWFAESCNRPNYAYLAYQQQEYVNGTATHPLPPRVDRNAYNLEVDDGPYLLGLAEQPLSHRIFVDPAGRAFRYEARAGLDNAGTLVEAYELSAEQRMPLAEADGAIFSSPPPQALTQLNFLESDQPFIGISTSEITFTQAISIISTPLWHLPPSTEDDLRGVYGTETPTPWGGIANNPFSTAVSRGLAVQLIYNPPVSDTLQLAHQLYVGNAEELGAFLRLDRFWRSAEPVALRVDGRSVQGWRVAQRDNQRWTLFELDGALIAIDSSTPQREARIAKLQPWAGE